MLLIKRGKASWIPGLSAFCVWALVPWCVVLVGAFGALSCRLVPSAGLVVWPCRCGLCPPGTVSSFFLFLATNHLWCGLSVEDGLPRRGDDPRTVSLDKYTLVRMECIRLVRYDSGIGRGVLGTLVLFCSSFFPLVSSRLLAAPNASTAQKRCAAGLVLIGLKGTWDQKLCCSRSCSLTPSSSVLQILIFCYLERVQQDLGCKSRNFPVSLALSACLPLRRSMGMDHSRKTLSQIFVVLPNCHEDEAVLGSPFSILAALLSRRDKVACSSYVVHGLPVFLIKRCFLLREQSGWSSQGRRSCSVVPVCVGSRWELQCTFRPHT